MSDDLSVRIGADTSGLQRGLRDSEQGLSKLSRSAMPAIKAIAAVGAAAAGAATAVALFTRAGMNAIDEQAKLARQLDSTIGGLRGLQLAGEDAGVATGTLNSAMQRLSARLGEAQSGTGAAADALRDLGLSARDLAGMDVDRRMATIADRVQELGLSGAQTANVLRDLGIRNTEMVNLLRQGGGAIRDARQEIEDYGLAIDSVDSAAIEAANDALSRVGLVVESIRSALAVELAPIVLEIADRFNTAAREAGGWGSVVTMAAENAALAVAKVADTFRTVQIAIAQGDVAVANLELGMAKFAENSWRAVGGFIDAWIDGLNNIISVMNRIPGMGGIEQVSGFGESGFMQGIIDQADIARGRFNLLQMDLNDLSSAPMPSEHIDGFFDAIEERRQKLADSIAEDGGLIPGMGGEDGELGVGSGATSEQQEEELERLREHLERRLEVLREGLMDEAELETHRHEQKLDELMAAHALELTTEEEHRELMRQVAEDHQDKLNAIEQRGADERARTERRVSDQIIAMKRGVAMQAANLLGTMAQDSKAAAIAQIALNKGLAIAQIIQNTAVAQMRAMAELGPIAGPPAAAKIGVMGKIQAGLAAATGLAQAAGAGGGGGSSSGAGVASNVQGGAGSANEAAQGSASPAGGTLTVEGISAGALFSGDAVKELAEELLSYQRRGGEIVIT